MRRALSGACAPSLGSCRVVSCRHECSFSPNPPPDGLMLCLVLHREKLDAILEVVKCHIISECRGSDMDAYLLRYGAVREREGGG